MFKILVMIILLPIFAGVYDYSLPALEGPDINLNQFRGKKLLFVNVTATSIHSSQLTSLQKLQEQFAQTLVVVAVPSNSFGNEAGDIGELVRKVKQQYKLTFLVTAPLAVTGTQQHPLYRWLTHASDNGRMNCELKGDFAKILVNASGQVQGFFHPSVGPQDSLLVAQLR